MNLFRAEEHARRWPTFQPRAEEGFITLAALAGFFGTETRRHMLDQDYLSAWYPRRAAERRAYLDRSTSAARSGWGPRTPAALVVTPPGRPGRAASSSSATSCPFTTTRYESQRKSR